MRMRKRRHQEILTLLRDHPIERQEQLQVLLRAQGMEVNQATLSRDLRAIGAVKTPDISGRATYGVTSRGPDRSIALGNLRAFLREMVPSGNLLVLKTQVGAAQPVALALDQLALDHIVGTVAGDDTILVVVAEGRDCRDVMEALWSLIDDGA